MIGIIHTIDRISDELPIYRFRHNNRSLPICQNHDPRVNAKHLIAANMVLFFKICQLPTDLFNPIRLPSVSKLYCYPRRLVRNAGTVRHARQLCSDVLAVLYHIVLGHLQFPG